MEFLYIKGFFPFITGEFVEENESIQSSWNECYQEELQEEPNVGVNQHDANSLTSTTAIFSVDSKLRSGSEEDKPIVEASVNKEPDNLSNTEEELNSTRSSLEMSPKVARLHTQGSNAEICDSDHKTEFNTNILRSHDSTTTHSVQCCETLGLSHKNTSAYSATAPTNSIEVDKDSSNGYLFDIGETSLKSAFSAASPDSDRFFVDAAVGVSATTEENSQPALNSPPSIRAFITPRNHSPQSSFRNNMQHTFGIELPSSSNYGPLASDYQSIAHMDDSSGDNISSNGSISTEHEDPVS